MDRARAVSRIRLAKLSRNTIGTSEVVSDPPAMPESICPTAILLATTMAASRLVPQARCSVIPGVCSSSPELRVISRARFQSLECLMTAPKATSPSRCFCSPNRSTAAATALTPISLFPMFAYAVLLRQKGIRAPPRMATRAGEFCLAMVTSLIRSGYRPSSVAPRPEANQAATSHPDAPAAPVKRPGRPLPPPGAEDWAARRCSSPGRAPHGSGEPAPRRTDPSRHG